MDLPAGTIVAGRYEVDQLLGRGGMASVYRVWHLGLGTSHALKVLGTTTDSVRERLLREGRLQGQLRHPNVVAVTDHVEVNGLPALVLEMVEGPSLAALLGGPPLTVAQVDAIGGGVLAGVAAAHRERLVHRDLKPGNVLVAIRDGRPVAKVADFGLALALDSDDPRQTRTGAHLGTPQYMSPEQVRDAKNVDERSDVWSLGALLYELATGKPPFSASDRLALFQAIAAGEYTPVEQHRPDLPSRMRATIERALVVEVEDRPRDAVELLAIWGELPPEAMVDPLVERVRSLAPPSSRGVTQVPSSGPWPPPRSSSDASFRERVPQAGPEPLLTWTPDSRAIELPPSSPPSSAATTASSVDPPPVPAVPAIPAAPRTPPAAAGGRSLLAASVGGAVALVAVLALIVAVTRQPTVVVVQPQPAPQPAPVEADAVVAELPRVAPVRATDLLLDGRFGEAGREADLLLASPGDEAEVLEAVALRAEGRWYAPLEPLETALRHDDERAGAMLAMQADPGRGADWLLAHDDDLEVRVWWVLCACPGPACAGAEPQVEALERLAPGRGIGAWARLVVARETGAVDEAEAALTAWAATAKEEPLVAVEEGRLRLAQGRYEDAASAVEPLLARPTSAPVGAVIVRGLADRELGREGKRVEADAVADRLLWDGRVAYARAIAAWEIAHGDPLGAARRLLASRHALDPFHDALVHFLDATVCLDLMEVGARLGDDELMRTAATGLATVATLDLKPWARQQAERDKLLGDGLRLAGRGQPDDAEAVLRQLQDAGASRIELDRLRAAIGGGG